MIQLTRIDHRLLHGQVAVAWTNYLRADCILIANDEVAENEFRKSTLRLAKPAGCKIVFKSIEDAASAINTGQTEKYKLFIIVETINDAKKLTETCLKIKMVNLGLSPPKENAKSLGKAVYADALEIEALKEMAKNGVSIEMQQAPKDLTININSLIRKNQL